MFKRWKELSELDCVKKFGIGHKIAHLLGVAMPSRCAYAIGVKSIEKHIKSVKG